MIKNAFKDRMPELPAYVASYRVIRLEPISQSGESFTIAVMAQSDSEYKVVQTIAPKTLKCMYGEKFNAISNLISIIIESATLHLKGGLPISEWRPPFEGVFVDKERSTRSSKMMEGILFQAISSFSSLYRGDIVTNAISSLNNEDEYEDHETIRLLDNIKQIIAEPYRKNFNKKAKLLTSPDVTIDYLGARYNANITNFRHSNAGSSIHRAKSKLIDFEFFYNERVKEVINEGHTYEFIIGCSESPTPKVEDAVGVVTEMARKIGVLVSQESSPQAIASRIVKAETATP